MSAPPVRRPNFFVVGAPKCGTSSLHRALAQHPDVFMPDVKEPHFFGEDHERLHHKRMTSEQYLALFGGARGEIRVGEASTSYMHSCTAAEEIRAFAPDARIIVMLRNPVDLMYAYHATQVKAGFEPIFDFEQALSAEGERKGGRQLPRSRPGIRESLYYRDVATLSPQLLRFQRTFGSESVKVIVFDDWADDAGAAYGETAQFLEIDPRYRPQVEVVNPNRRVRNQVVHRLLHNPPLPLRRFASVFPRDRRARLVYAASRANTRVASRPSMRPALRQALLEEFSPEIERLGNLVGRDLSHWARGERLKI